MPEPFSATAPLKSVKGTSTKPGVTFTGDEDTGLYNSAPDELAVSLGGSEKAKFTGTGVNLDGDITLDDGGTYNTTLQMVTPTANRTISFPDATGTVALVAGSSGQFLYNNAGALAGSSTLIIDGDGNISLSGRLINTASGLASEPPVSLTGFWYSGGTSTTTKPQVLIEPSGTTSTAWSTSGTGLGVNAPSGFSGRLLDLQTNGTSRMVVQGDGKLGLGTSSPGSLLTVQANTTSYGVGGIKIETAGSNESFLAFGVSSSLGAAYITSSQNSTGENLPIYFNTGSGPTTAMCIDTSQRVGIGTASPQDALHIAVPSAVLRLEDTDTNHISTIQSTAAALVLSADVTNTVASSYLGLSVDGSERARIDSSGRLLVGTPTASTIRGYEPNLQVVGGSAPESTIAVYRHTTSTSSSNGPRLVLARSGANTLDNTIVADGNTLGEIAFCGADGVNLNIRAASIAAEVDGTPGADDMPGRLVFSTTADGASSPTERMRITSDAYVRLASGTGGIQFNGDTAAANALDDYEEGFWTPKLSVDNSLANITYNSQTGKYTKIGNLVYVSGEIDVASYTLVNTGQLEIPELPFTVASPTGNNYQFFQVTISGIDLTQFGFPNLSPLNVVWGRVITSDLLNPTSSSIGVYISADSGATDINPRIFRGPYLTGHTPIIQFSGWYSVS